MKHKLWVVIVPMIFLCFSSPVFAAPPPNGEPELEAEEVDVAVVGSAEVSVSVVGDTLVDMALIGDTEVGLGIEGNASEVGIDIEGDQTQLGVDITGEESTVTINGVTPFVTYHTRGSQWAKNQVKDVILPWMADAESIIALNADDLSNAILLAESNESDLMRSDFLLDVYDDRLTRLKSEVDNLDSESENLAMRINALEVEGRVMDDYLEYQTAYYNYQTAQSNQMIFYNRALMVMGALGITAFGLWMRARSKK